MNNESEVQPAAYIGIDLGGTNIVCGAVDSNGTVLHKLKQPTEAHKGSNDIIAKMADMVSELAHLTHTKGKIRAIGLGCPGIVNPELGLSVDSSNLSWRNVAVGAELQRLTGLPVHVDHDVRMYVYGEAMAGAGRDFRHVLGVTLGTGLACAFVNDGELFYGGGFMAGELGHIRGENIEYRCNCGNIGCLETVLSATGIARQAVEQLKSGRDSILCTWFKDQDYSKLTAADISKGYDQNDPVCLEIMDRTGRLLGHSLAIAASLYSPDVIIVGGGASLAGERLFGPARETLYAELLPIQRNRIVFKPAELTDDAGVIGSALHASKLLTQHLGG